MLKYVFVLFFACLPFVALAEDVVVGEWGNDLVLNLNLSQAEFDNWAAGGENVAAWLLGVDGEFKQEQKPGIWRNTLKLRYGSTQTADQEAQKSDDEIKGETLYTFRAKEGAQLYLAASVLTQFTESFDYSTSPKTRISNFMDPGYFTQSAGYSLKMSEELNVRAGVAVKETVANDFKNFSDGKSLLVQTGAEAVVEYKTKLGESSTFKSKLETFYDGRGLKELDYYWDNTLVSEITSGVNFTFNYKLIYDRDASTKLQRKNSLSAGVSYVIL